VWVGIGTVGTVLLAVVVHGDPATPARMVCLALIVVGVLGLKFVA